MWVKPAEGLRVRDYRTFQPIPATGVLVDDYDPVFAQLLNHGDVVECDAPADDEPAQAEAAAAESVSEPAAAPTPTAAPRAKVTAAPADPAPETPAPAATAE